MKCKTYLWKNQFVTSKKIFGTMFLILTRYQSQFLFTIIIFDNLDSYLHELLVQRFVTFWSKVIYKISCLLCLTFLFEYSIYIIQTCLKIWKKVLMNFIQKMDVLVWILTTWVQFKRHWRKFSMREGSVIVCTNFEWI